MLIEISATPCTNKELFKTRNWSKVNSFVCNDNIYPSCISPYNSTQGSLTTQYRRTKSPSKAEGYVLKLCILDTWRDKAECRTTSAALLPAEGHTGRCRQNKQPGTPVWVPAWRPEQRYLLASYLLPSGLPLEPGPQSGGSRGRKRAEVCGRLRNPRRAPSSTFPPWGMETAREGSPALPAHPRSLQLLTHTPVEEVSRRGGDASQAKGIFLDGLLTLTCRQFREWWWLHAVTSHYKTSSFTERLSDACFPRNPKANTTFLTSFHTLSKEDRGNPLLPGGLGRWRLHQPAPRPPPQLPPCYILLYTEL